jgi:hypothetical protein
MNHVLIQIDMYPQERSLDYKICTKTYYEDSKCEHSCEAVYFATQEDLQKYLNRKEKQKFAIITKNNGEYLLARSFID